MPNPKTYKLKLIFDNKKMTSIMRRLDLFEDFKFIRLALEATKLNNEFLPEWINTDDYTLAAQILGGKYIINPDYADTLISDGKHFTALESYLKLEI